MTVNRWPPDGHLLRGTMVSIGAGYTKSSFELAFWFRANQIPRRG